MARTDKDQDILKAFEEDTDAFFDSLLAGESSAPSAKAEPKAAPKAAEGGFIPPARTEVPKAAPKAEAPAPEQQPAVPKAQVPTVPTSEQQPAKAPPAAPRAEVPSTLPVATAAEKMQAPVVPTSESQPAKATPAAPRVEVHAPWTEVRLNPAYPQEDKLEELDTTGTSQSTQEKSERAAMFRMDSSGSEEAEVAQPDYDHSEVHHLTAPPPPADFSTEDIVLHETLEDFYTQHRQTNMSNINAIVTKYRGHMVPHLWAQLSLKYNLAPLEGLELLGRSLYQSAPFEYREQERQTELEGTLAEVRKVVLAEGLAPSRTVLLERAMTRGAKDGNDGLLRLLAYRGLPDDQSLRAKVWKASSY
eukprot:s885_g1.t1